MSILGNNLLAQYYAQNQFKYIDNPELWIEADSWGTSTWMNKGNGGYDLTCNNSLSGVRQDNAVIATTQNPVYYSCNNNVAGTSSFTVEMVIIPSSALQSTPYGGWLVSQRKNNAVPSGTWQTYISNSLVYGIGAWENNQYISSGMDILASMPNVTQYCAFGYNSMTKTIWKQVNQNIVNKSDVDFSCSINFTTVGCAAWDGRLAFLGSIYSLRVYQRALSEQERANNMRRDKARFNF